MRWTFRTVNAKVAIGLRESFRASLIAQRIDEGDLFIAELIMGELISNVVRHAPGFIDASYEHADHELTIHVCDSGQGFARNARLPDEFSENGRGLFLISSVGGVLSVSPTTTGGSRTSVRIVLERPLVAPVHTAYLSLAS